MMDDDYYGYSKKTVTLHRNGDPTSHVLLTIRGKISHHDLLKEIANKLELRASKNMRIFNQKGIEFLEDDIDLIQNKDDLYISLGEDFDQLSSFAEYEIVKILGQGGMGQVSLGIHKQTKEKVAIKISKEITGGSATDIDTLFSEAEALKSLNHKNIVRIKNCFTLKNMQVVYVMEYLEGGELLALIEEKGRLTEDEAKNFFRQLSDAMAYCHREKIIHRDLKLENLMLTAKDSNILKVLDFGVAGLSAGVNSDVDKGGSVCYLAPEVLDNKVKAVHPSQDIWAMGCILYGMLVGQLPFFDRSGDEVVRKILNGTYAIPATIDKILSPECKDLIKRILNKDPAKRITMSGILEHPWLTGARMEILEEDTREETKEALKEVSRKVPLTAKRSSMGSMAISTAKSLVRKDSLSHKLPASGHDSPKTPKSALLPSNNKSSPDRSPVTLKSPGLKPSDKQSAFAKKK